MRVRPSQSVLNRHNRHDPHDGYDGRDDNSEYCPKRHSMAISPLHHEGEKSSTDSSLAPTSYEFISDCSLKTEEWLTSEEAAKFLRISVKALLNMASNGYVPFYKLGRRNRYRKDELEALLLSQKRGKYGNQA